MTRNPFRHPFHKSARECQRSDARAELRRYLDSAAALRTRMEGARILPARPTPAPSTGGLAK